MANNITSSEILEMIEALRHDESLSAREALGQLATDLKKRLDDSYLGDYYRTDYVVGGTGEFPHDMLRYTQSWPKDEEDARKIGSDYEGPRRVTLTKYHRDPKPNLAEDRWMSKFRWTVVEVLDTVAR